MAATPIGWQVARNGRCWLRAVTRSPAVLCMRSDRRRNITKVAEFLSVARQYDHGVIRPGLPVLMAETGLTERTLYRALSWLRSAGWLAHVQRGSTERYRGRPDGRGPLAAEHALLLPHPVMLDRKNGSPSRFPSGSVLPLSRATAGTTRQQTQSPENRHTTPLRGANSSRPPTGGNRGLERETSSQPRRWSPEAVTATKADRTEAARALRNQLPVLNRLSVRSVRSLIRAFYAAGWTNRDVVWALDNRPDGHAHQHTQGVRHIDRWVMARLASWTTDDGAVLSSRTQQRVTEAAAERAALAAARERLLADLAATPPATDEARSTARAAIANILARRKQSVTPADQQPLYRPSKGWLNGLFRL